LLSAWRGSVRLSSRADLRSGLAGEKITLLLGRRVGVLRFAGDDDRANLTVVTALDLA
jgi:hypothetical protein